MSIGLYIGIAVGLLVLSGGISVAKRKAKQRKKDLEANGPQVILPPPDQQVENELALQRLRDAENREAFGNTARGYVAVPQKLERLRQPPSGHVHGSAPRELDAGGNEPRELDASGNEPRELDAELQRVSEVSGERNVVELEGGRIPPGMGGHETVPSSVSRHHTANVDMQPLQP
jgi:hypothetical protein